MLPYGTCVVQEFIALQDIYRSIACLALNMCRPKVCRSQPVQFSGVGYFDNVSFWVCIVLVASRRMLPYGTCVILECIVIYCRACVALNVCRPERVSFSSCAVPRRALLL